MGALVPLSQWVPEDDALLKSAVEAGASLESLAKGAVQFSRRYTVKELQDRWYSLLYDPVVATEAAPRMLEVMRCGAFDQSRPNKSEAVSGKRKKAESIRKCYYAMRKRICNEPLDIMGIDLLPEPIAPDFENINGLGIQCPNIDVGPHPFPELGPNSPNDLQFGRRFMAHDVSFTYEDSNLPLDRADDGIPGLEQSGLFGPEACLEGPEFGTSDSGPFCNFTCPSSTMPQMPMLPGDDFAIQPSCNENMTDTYLAELSNTLFSDDLRCSDGSPKDGIETSYFEGLSSLLTYDVSPSPLELPDSQSGPDAGPQNLENTSGGLHLLDEDFNKAASPQATIPARKELGPEYRNGVICCTFNTEDPEIPNNEDVFLPIRFHSPSDILSGAHWKFEDPSYLVPQPPPSYIEDLPTVPQKVKAKVGLPVMKNNSQMGSCGPSRISVPTVSSDKGSKYMVVEKGVKFELPDSNIQQAVLRNARKSEGYSCLSILANVSGNGGVTKEGSMDVGRGKKVDCFENRECRLDVLESLQKRNDNGKGETLNVGLASGELSCRKTIEMPPIDEYRVSDSEELSENDVPCFSEVEAMILDMDLFPDMYTNPEVERYMHEESKRTIVRLEQLAEACTHRAIASQGAFAVLYGRRSKHFIKNPEVIIGRATEDNKVDIDLGREKNGGKISRRQAIIKMDMHGTFELINVGKSWIHVNGKEVPPPPGHSVSLTSGCLVEVRGLAFVFETNPARINRFLKNPAGGD